MSQSRRTDARHAIRYLVPLAAVLLAGCVTAEERADREARYRDALALECSRFGFQPGTADHGNCMMRLHLSGGYRERSVGEMLKDFGDGVGRPTTTRCTTLLGQITCTTY